jgi:SAM-dependent methyltransferase
MSQDRERRENDLIAYYDNEVRARADRELPDARVTRRTAYLQRLHQEERHTVLEIGCGPGRDGQAIADAGFSYVGVDLAPASVDACRRLGLDARVGSVLELPFEDASFDAGWTMSTLLHVADDDLDQAMSEILRVLRPGAPLAVGLWGSATSGEQVWQDDKGFGPGRFFSTRTDDGLRATLERYGSVDEWETWNDDGDGPMHYQWAVLTVSGDPGSQRK